MKNQKVSRKLYHFVKNRKKRRSEKTNFFLGRWKKKNFLGSGKKKFVHFWPPFFLSFFIIFTKWFIILLLFSIFKIELRYCIFFTLGKITKKKKNGANFGGNFCIFWAKMQKVLPAILKKFSDWKRQKIHER